MGNDKEKTNPSKSFLGSLISVLAISFTSITIFSLCVYVYIIKNQGDTIIITGEGAIEQATTTEQVTSEYEKDTSNNKSVELTINETDSKDFNYKKSERIVLNHSNYEEMDDSTQQIEANESAKMTEGSNPIEQYGNEEYTGVYTDVGDEDNEIYEDDVEEKLDNEYDNRTYTLQINSPGQLVLMSADQINQMGAVNISYESNETESEPDESRLDCDFAELVNSVDSLEQDSTKYINVLPGVYCFECFDCDLDDVVFELFQMDDYTESEDESVDGSDDYEEECANGSDDYEEYVDSEMDESGFDEGSMLIPTEQVDVSLSQDELWFKQKLTAKYDFTPEISFYSEADVGGVLRILDEEGYEIYMVELNSVNTYDADLEDSDFQFEAGKVYYLEIVADYQEDILEYTYYYEIAESTDDYVEE